MSSSTSNSDVPNPRDPKPGAPKNADGGARLFLGMMAAGLVLSAAAAMAAPESFIHTAPEFGMAEAFEDHIEAACTAKAQPDMLIIGDSRAVAGVSVNAIKAAGISAEKFALGGSGIFTGWAALDRLVDCGVRPKTVVMAYGTVHMLDQGALMDRTTNYDLLKGPRAGHAYDMASQWEQSAMRRLAYKAISVAGTEPTLVDLVLMRPALRNVLENPPLALKNNALNEEERAGFLARGGDRFYGVAERASGPPDEAKFGEMSKAPEMNYKATEAIAQLGRDNGFNVVFYILPVSESAKAGLPKSIFSTADDFRARLAGMGVTALNDVWVLPDDDFGDPSHVNARGRAKVTADFLARFAASAGDLAARNGAGVPGNPVGMHTQR